MDTRLVDEQQTICTITALVLAALAMAATPYGIEAFDFVLMRLWKSIWAHRSRGLLEGHWPLMDESATPTPVRSHGHPDQPRQL